MEAVSWSFYSFTEQRKQWIKAVLKYIRGYIKETNTAGNPRCSLSFRVGGSYWPAKATGSKGFLTISHRTLVLTQRWARNHCSGGLKRARDMVINLRPVPLESLHSPEILVHQSADAGSFQIFHSQLPCWQASHVCMQGPHVIYLNTVRTLVARKAHS